MSRKIFSYRGGGWGSFSIPTGASLIDLASDGASLYALVSPGGEPLGSSEIYKFDGVWTRIGRGSVSNGYSIQTLYAAPDGVFAGAQIGNQYAILRVKDGALEVIPGGNSLLRGVAKTGSGFYLATAGSGIFKYDGTSITRTILGGKIITGVISVGDHFVAVSNNENGSGTCFILDSSGAVRYELTGDIFTGGMCLWQNDGNSLLLLGVRGQGNSLSQGYRELVLTTEGGRLVPTSTLKLPGDSPSSVSDANKYNASIGKHAVESIRQFPNSPIIFASTAKDGLWSYRPRGSRGYEWNAED
jgi:hypothetical protein